MDVPDAVWRACRYLGRRTERGLSRQDIFEHELAGLLMPGGVAQWPMHVIWASEEDTSRELTEALRIAGMRRADLVLPACLLTITPNHVKIVLLEAGTRTMLWEKQMTPENRLKLP